MLQLTITSCVLDRGAPSPLMARQPLQARLTEAAAAAWSRACTRHHVTFTALIEALGELEPADWVPAEAVERAREIDRQRRSRR